MRGVNPFMENGEETWGGLWGHVEDVGNRRDVHQSESSNPMEYSKKNGIQTSSPVTDNGFFSDFGATGLAIGCACALAGIFICLGTYIWIKNRRRKQKLLRELTFNGCEESTIITKSAPNSRCGSPKLGKRMSCPDAFGSRSMSGGVLVKSWTLDPILDSIQPPERVQPKPSTDPMIFHPDLSEDSDQSPPESSHGRIWFSTFYDIRSEQLNVNLMKVKDLPKRELTQEDPDPFVKIYLLPDEKACQVSKSKKKTSSPIYNELHRFQVAPYEMKDRVLRFSVYDVDKRRVRRSLGHISIDLNSLDLDKGEIMCSDLESSVQSASSLGDVQISLGYYPAKEKVKIGVHRAKKLQLDRDYAEKGAYVRIQLFYGHKCHRIKRTVTRPLSENCPFDESLSFTIQGRQLESCSLVVSVMLTQLQYSTKDDVEYGRVVIGPFMYARGEQLLHWQEMLAQSKRVTTHWHSLVNSI